MKQSFEPYPHLQQVLDKYSKKGLSLNITQFKDIEIDKQYVCSTKFNKIANLFTIAVYPCVSTLQLDKKLYLFTNLSKTKTVLNSSKNTISTSEYCSIITSYIKQAFDTRELVSENAMWSLECLFYAKASSCIGGGVRTMLRDHEVRLIKNGILDSLIHGQNIKQHLAPNNINKYEDYNRFYDTINEKIDLLIRVGERVRFIMDEIYNPVIYIKKDATIDNSDPEYLKKDKHYNKLKAVYEKAIILFPDTPSEELSPYINTDWLPNISEALFFNKQEILKHVENFRLVDNMFNTIDFEALLSKNPLPEIHAEILAKIFSKNEKIDIGVSKEYCILCGILFAMDAKTLEITKEIMTHGKYSLQKGLESIITKNVHTALPKIVNLRFSNNDDKPIDTKIQDDIIQILKKNKQYTPDITNKDKQSVNITLQELTSEIGAIKEKKVDNFHGFKSSYKEGLTRDDINHNLRKLKELPQNCQNDLTLSDKIINRDNVLDNLTTWIINSKSDKEYLSIIGVKNNNEYHACIMQVINNNKQLQINIIDPLSKEDSEFTTQLNELKSSVEKELTQYVDSVQCNIIYSGIQDKNYGTCGDMCLIMIQQLIEVESATYQLTNDSGTNSNNEILDQCNYTSSSHDEYYDIGLAGDVAA